MKGAFDSGNPVYVFFSGDTFPHVEQRPFPEAEGVELPRHYAELLDSLDCWICPTQWSMVHAPAYSQFLRRAYPQFAETVLPTAPKIYDYAERSTATMREALLGQ